MPGLVTLSKPDGKPAQLKCAAPAGTAKRRAAVQVRPGYLFQYEAI